MLITKTMPFTRLLRNVEQNALTVWPSHENENSENPFPFCGLSTAPCFWEFLVSLSRQWVLSLLKALDSICAVTLGSWESGDGWKALKPQRPICKRGLQASTGMQKVNTNSQGLPLDITSCSRSQGRSTQGWNHGERTDPNLTFKCSPAKGWGWLLRV